MTAAEAYELTTQGGTTDFARAIAACEASGPWCLIGGLAVDAFVEPVYTLDADLVVVASGLHDLVENLRQQGFAIEEHEHSLNAQRPGSDLRIQFTIDTRYQVFLARSVEAVVLGIPVRVACLEDTTQVKLWAWNDPKRRFSKRKKDELDLIRLAEAWPELRAMYPKELLDLIDKG
ncbi:MAG TPA: hypothetical protein VGL82_03345 [Bryobacteraceae bacterium]